MSLSSTSTLTRRAIARVRTTPPLGPGFAGPTHKNAEIIPPGGFTQTDPFFLMNDDHAISGGPLGGAHPHAGLETVSFLVSGELSSDGFTLKAGDVEWMTAGRGVVHSEGSDTPAGFRLLQLWVAMPGKDNDLPPRLQLVRREHVPVVKTPGVEAHVYSGASHEVVSPTHNVVPVTIVDMALKPGARFTQELPLSYNGFIYVLEGAVIAGASDTPVSVTQAAWLDRPDANGVNESSVLELTAGDAGARVILYAGEPVRENLAWYGPFIAGSQDGLRKHFDAYRRGEFPLAAQLSHEEVLSHI